MLQWALGCIYLLEVWFSPDLCTEVELLDNMVVLYLILHSVLLNSCMNLCSCQQCRRVPFSPHPLQHYYLYTFVVGHSDWYEVIIVVLIFISLIISDVEDLFMCYWPSVCRVWRNVCLDLPPIFWLNCLFLYIEFHELFMYFGD